MGIREMVEVLEDVIKILKIYGEMMESGNCNTCAINRSCQYCPELGKIVRVNCPLYVEKKTGVVKVVNPHKDKGNENQL